MIRKTWLMPVLGAALIWPVLAAAMGGQKCREPEGCGNAPNSGNQVKSFPVYKRAAPASHNKTLTLKTLGGETLTSRIDGAHDIVQGLLTFPWTSQEGLDLELVALSLPATATGSDNEYTVSGWHRELFFLDVGDSVPRLLSATLIDPEFVPDPQDEVTKSGQLWIADFALYQEAEELEGNPDFYAGFPDGGSLADLRFVTDAEGNVLELVVDIFDATGENYLYSVPPRIGDRFNPSLNGYDLTDPDIIYALFYFPDFIEVTDELFVQRQYFVPTGEIDQVLPEGFDSGPIQLSFFLEGIRFDGDDNAMFSYGEVETFDYTWAEAKSSLEGSTSGSRSGGAAGLPMLILLLGLGWARRRVERARTY